MLKRRDFIYLIGGAAVTKWPLAASAQRHLNYLDLGDKTIGLLKIEQSRLFVRLTALDRAEGIAELTRLEHKRMEVAQREQSSSRPAEGAIGTAAEKIGIARNLVRRSSRY